MKRTNWLRRLVVVAVLVASGFMLTPAANAAKTDVCVGPISLLGQELVRRTCLITLPF